MVTRVLFRSSSLLNSFLYIGVSYTHFLLLKIAEFSDSGVACFKGGDAADMNPSSTVLGPGTAVCV